MNFKKNSKTIFLDKSFNQTIEDDVKLNIILSPSLYWVKKVSLSVKFVRDVIKFLPSIFEDQLLDNKEYKYFAYKDGDDFIAFAYNEKEILDLLKEKKISKSNIEHIYFAQSEFSNISVPIKINSNEVLYLKDNIVVLLPSSWVEKSKPLNLENLTLSKHYIELTQFGNILNKKSFYTLVAILLAFIFLNGFEYFTNLQRAKELENKKDKIFVKYNLKPTLFQNKSLLKKYKKLHKKQLKIRDIIAVITNIKLKNNTKLSLLNVKDKKIVSTFSDVKKDDKNYILNYFKSKKLKIKSSYKKSNLTIEVTI